MNVEKQETFGWLVAVDLFLAGVGAGVFFISFIMALINRYESFTGTGAITGPVLVLLGTLLLFADLRNKRRFYRLICNPSSWMSRGTWGIASFIIFGLAYSIPALVNPDVVTSVPFLIIGIMASISAVVVIFYTGFLFNAAKRVPFWNTPLLPVLFFFSSLYTGMAVFLFTASAGMGAPDNTFRVMVITEMALILVHLIVLGVFLGLAHVAGNSTAQSARLLIRCWIFIIIVVIAGMIVPLVLLLYQSFTLNTFLPTLIASVLLLIGGFFLRQVILKSGVRLTVSKDQLGLTNSLRRSSPISE